MRNFILFSRLILLFVGCDTLQKEKATPFQVAPRIECNSIYHWKTVYNPDSAELQFLQQHKVRRMYVRFFDVDCLSDGSIPIPIATTQFAQAFPDSVEIVPTIFISVRALKVMKKEPQLYSRKIAQRLFSMIDGNGMGSVHEMQFDCDWTQSTQQDYFHLLSLLTDTLHRHGISTSATIRLHQLSQTLPPVDRGVLMLYNTGSIRSTVTENSILHYDDIAPYFKKSIKYDLPLDFAYPTYTWAIWFRNNEFQAILRTTDFSDRTHFVPIEENRYRVIADIDLEHHSLKKGDIVRLEQSDAQKILQVKQLVESRLKQTQHSNIIYHLDHNNLSKYTIHEIDSIYARL